MNNIKSLAIGIVGGLIANFIYSLNSPICILITLLITDIILHLGKKINYKK